MFVCLLKIFSYDILNFVIKQLNLLCLDFAKSAAADQNPPRAAPTPISPPKERWPSIFKPKKPVEKVSKYAPSASKLKPKKNSPQRSYFFVWQEDFQKLKNVID
jgi:hypothetical protein